LLQIVIVQSILAVIT